MSGLQGWGRGGLKTGIPQGSAQEADVTLSKSWRKLEDKAARPSPPVLVQPWPLMGEQIIRSTTS